MTNEVTAEWTQEDWNELSGKLKAPFPESEIKVRVGGTFKNGASGIALPYIDARQVMERLDAIVGPQNWSDTYKAVDSQSVICELTIFGITKSDAGQSKADGSTGEVKALKAAVSDALKRAAVKWGIGQFLYSLPIQFEDLKNKKFVRNQRAIVRDILRKSGLTLEVPGKSPYGPGPKPQPAPKEVELRTSLVHTRPEPTTEPPTSRPVAKGLTVTQKDAIQDLKVKLKIRDNTMLNPFVVDWSQKKLSSYRDLNTDNVDDFMKFLNSKYNTVVA